MNADEARPIVPCSVARIAPSEASKALFALAISLALVRSAATTETSSPETFSGGAESAFVFGNSPP